MRLLEALLRTGTRRRTLDRLLDAQDGPEVRIDRGFDLGEETVAGEEPG